MTSRAQNRPAIIGVIGAGSCDSSLRGTAERVGELIAERGCVLVCGGLGGVMEAASKGAHNKGGVTIGILPGSDRDSCNQYISLPIVTDLGHARNVIIAHTATALIAVGGQFGTLSEIAISLKLQRPVVVIGKWSGIDGVIPATSPEEALALIFDALGRTCAS